MTTYTFNPNPKEQFVDWNDPSVWVGGVVPNSPDAVVVIPTVTTVATAQVYDSFITLAGSNSVKSVSIANNFLTINGSLAVLGDFSAEQGASIQLSGGSLSFNTFENDNPYSGVGGNGQMEGSGLFTNNGEVDGSGLTLTSAALTNNGTLVAYSGDLSVDVRPGGFTNISSGVLTGGVFCGWVGIFVC